MTTASGHTTAIRAKKVLGTTVYDWAGKKIGSVEDVVLDKTSNNIMFAVLGFGGLMGMGEKYCPMPWSKLEYSEQMNGYTVDVNEAQLKAAPQDSIDLLTRGDGTAYREKAFKYYEARPYRM
jgi:sporulation protein YlmC with PRC-barrel domain